MDADSHVAVKRLIAGSMISSKCIIVKNDMETLAGRLRIIIVAMVLACISLPLALAQDVAEDGWVLRATNPDPLEYYGVTAANGVIGLVSSPEPLGIAETVLAGVYDFYGRGRVNNFLPNINPLRLSLSIDGTRIKRTNISNFVQSLDMRNGEFVGELDFRGVHVSYRYCALRHIAHAALMEVSLSAEADVEIEARIEHLVPSSLHGASMMTNSFEFHHKADPPYTVITTTALSPNETVTTAVSSAFLFPEQDRDIPVIHKQPSSDSHSISFSKTVRQGETYKFSVVGSLISSAHTADPLNQAERIVTYARFQHEGELLRRHRLAWENLWKSDIVIEGDHQAQKEVRSMLYHLYSFTREGIAYSPSPMGLSGLGYNGHVFWDSEMFIMPPLLMLHPELACSMLEYRFQRLDEAQRNAAAYGFMGAMYPWESASTGAEDTPVTSLCGTFQHHVTADVAIGFWRYYLATGDKEWLENRGWPVLKATAEFWASRAEKKDDGFWHIDNVMCADEWALNKDDNAYTNAAAALNLRYAVEAGRVLGHETPAAWRDISEGLFFDRMDNGVTLEHKGYDGAEIKQADVNLLAFPLQVITDRRQMILDLDYYSKKVPQKKTPAMTQSMFSVICSRCGDADQAWKWFVDSYRPNALPPFGVLAEFKVGANPYFATGAGGTLQAVIFGFAGLDFAPGGGVTQLQNHALPSHWKKLTIKGIGPEKKTYVIE